MRRFKTALLRRSQVHFIGAILLLLLTSQARSAESDSALVHAVLFYSPTCQHCTYVKEKVLPPILSRYGSKLQLATVNTTTPSGYELFLNACLKHGNSRLSVPMLIVGNTAMVGDTEIPQKFPELIEKDLAAGGVEWPKIQGLSAMLAANPAFLTGAQKAETSVPQSAVNAGPAPSNAKPPVESAPATTAAAKKDRIPEPPKIVANAGQNQSASAFPPPASNEKEPSIARTAPSSHTAPTTSSGVIELTKGESEFGPIDRLKRDIYGNGLAILVLAGMALTLLVSPKILKRSSTPTIEDIRPRYDWLIPVLALAGIGVAAYLSNVEVRHVEAVCGPIGDCNTVNQSPYARLFGAIPIGVLGMIGFVAILAAWFLRRWGSVRIALLAAVGILCMTAFGVFFSVYLTFLEPFVIGATCLWCLSSAVIMTTLFALALKPGRQAFRMLKNKNATDFTD